MADATVSHPELGAELRREMHAGAQECSLWQG